MNIVVIWISDCVVDGTSPTQGEWNVHPRAELSSALTPDVCWTAIKHVADKLEANKNASMEGFSWLSCICCALSHLCSCD